MSNAGMDHTSCFSAPQATDGSLNSISDKKFKLCFEADESTSEIMIFKKDSGIWQPSEEQEVPPAGWCGLAELNKLSSCPRSRE